MARRLPLRSPCREDLRGRAGPVEQGAQLVDIGLEHVAGVLEAGTAADFEQRPAKKAERPEDADTVIVILDPVRRAGVRDEIGELGGQGRQRWARCRCPVACRGADGPKHELGSLAQRRPEEVVAVDEPVAVLCEVRVEAPAGLRRGAHVVEGAHRRRIDFAGAQGLGDR